MADNIFECFKLSQVIAFICDRQNMPILLLHDRFAHGFAIRTGYKLTLEKIPFLNVQLNVKNGMRIEEVLSLIFG